MLKIIEDEAAIKKCHTLFTKSFKTLRNWQVQVRIGHQGASTLMKVSWSAHLELWNVSSRIPGTSYWNAFGLGKPEPAAYIPIVCEINFPARGIDRRLGGAMAKDRYGRVFAVHRGKIGGGKKGIGKTLFEDLYRGAWTIMEDGGTVSTVALIGELRSPRFARQAAQFVRKIGAIKNHVSPAAVQLPLPFGHQFREALIGQSYGHCVPTEAGICDHGLVVRDLYAELTRYGLKAANGESHDLTIFDHQGKQAAIFGIATDTSVDILYAESTRLLLSAVRMEERPRTVLVVPEETAVHPLADLQDLSIERLDYRWQNDRAIFPGLRRFIPAQAHSSR